MCTVITEWAVLSTWITQSTAASSIQKRPLPPTVQYSTEALLHAHIKPMAELHVAAATGFQQNVVKSGQAS